MNYRKGFVAPLLIAIAVVVIGGGVYAYTKYFRSTGPTSYKNEAVVNTYPVLENSDLYKAKFISTDIPIEWNVPGKNVVIKKIQENKFSCGDKEANFVVYTSYNSGSNYIGGWYSTSIIDCGDYYFVYESGDSGPKLFGPFDLNKTPTTGGINQQPENVPEKSSGYTLTPVQTPPNASRINSISILSPKSGVIWQTSGAYQISWTTSGIPLDTQGYVLLKNTAQGGDYYVVNKSVALNGGASSNYGGSRTYTIPQESASFLPGRYVIRIGVGRYEDYDGAKSMYFDSAPFEIKGLTSTAAPNITILSPNGGEKLVKGQTYKITWKSSTDFTSEYKQVSLTLVAGNADQAVIPNQQIITANTGSYDWTVPYASLSAYIQDYSGGPYTEKNVDNQTVFKFLIEGYPSKNMKAAGPHDYSDNYFSIVK